MSELSPNRQCNGLSLHFLRPPLNLPEWLSLHLLRLTADYNRCRHITQYVVIPT